MYAESDRSEFDRILFRRQSTRKNVSSFPVDGDTDELLRVMLQRDVRNWVVEGHGVDHILMAFESKKLRSTVNVPNFTRSVITACQASGKKVYFTLSDIKVIVNIFIHIYIYIYRIRKRTERNDFY